MAIRWFEGDDVPNKAAKVDLSKGEVIITLRQAGCVVQLRKKMDVSVHKIWAYSTHMYDKGFC